MKLKLSAKITTNDQLEKFNEAVNKKVLEKKSGC